jgi:Catalase
MPHQPIAPKTLTKSSGAPVVDNLNNSSAGPRGPVLLQDDRLLEETGDMNQKCVPELKQLDPPTAIGPTVLRPPGFIDFQAGLFGAFAFLDRGNERDFITVSKQTVMSKSYTPAQIAVDGQMKTEVQLNPGDIYGYMTSFGSYGKFHVESVEPDVVISFETYR